MTGRYLIHMPYDATAEARKRSWHTFTEVCRSLHRDGLTYDVEFHLGGSTARADHRDGDAGASKNSNRSAPRYTPSAGTVCSMPQPRVGSGVVSHGEPEPEE
jgi:hypothetical protein